MKPGVKLIAIAKLRAHEQVCPQRLVQVMAAIKRSGRINNPVIVDQKNKIVLDGHHRVESLKRLGCRLVPVMEVNYLSDQVRVYPRRSNIKISKKTVVNTVLHQQLFPHKTTKHLIKNRIREVKINLNRLK
jgi:hypothetical protein